MVTVNRRILFSKHETKVLYMGVAMDLKCVLYKVVSLLALFSWCILNFLLEVKGGIFLVLVIS